MRTLKLHTVIQKPDSEVSKTPSFKKKIYRLSQKSQDTLISERKEKWSYLNIQKTDEGAYLWKNSLLDLKW